MKCEYTERVFEPNLLRIGWVATYVEWVWLLGVGARVACVRAGGAQRCRCKGFGVSCWLGGGGGGWRVVVVLCMWLLQIRSLFFACLPLLFLGATAACIEPTVDPCTGALVPTAV